MEGESKSCRGGWPLSGTCLALAPLFVSAWGIMSCNYQRWLPDKLFCSSAFSQDKIPYFMPPGCQGRGAGGCHPIREKGEMRNEGKNDFICSLRCWREGRHEKPPAWGE